MAEARRSTICFGGWPKDWAAADEVPIPGFPTLEAQRLTDALLEAQQRVQTLLERGLQRDGDFENRWPALLGTLLET